MFLVLGFLAVLCFCPFAAYTTIPPTGDSAASILPGLYVFGVSLGHLLIVGRSDG